MTTAYQIAERFIGMEEVPGKENSLAIMAMLKLDGDWPQDDEVPWCSAFTNYIAWLLRLPRSKSLRARSWLGIGIPVGGPGPFDMTPSIGNCVVVLKRGGRDQPGPDVINAPGHVGFYAGTDGDRIHVLGGNQGDSVSVARFHKDRVLGIRRLA